MAIINNIGQKTVLLGVDSVVTSENIYIEAYPNLFLSRLLYCIASEI